jgi:hypothetical protein
MTRDRKDIEGALLKKGFRKREGDHHFYIYHTIAGLKSRIFTKTSHSHKTISDDLLSMMARQCRLPRQQFFNLIDCPLTKDAYEQILTEQGLL